jgi:hypothetical protein
MIADSLRDVILILSFLAFHSPVNVSTTIAKPIKNSIPDIGKKKAPITVNICVKDCLIVASKMANCSFILQE